MVVTDLRSALAASFRVSHVLVSGCGALGEPGFSGIRVSGLMRGSGCLRTISGFSPLFFKHPFSKTFLDLSSLNP